MKNANLTSSKKLEDYLDLAFRSPSAVNSYLRRAEKIAWHEGFLTTYASDTIRNVAALALHYRDSPIAVRALRLFQLLAYYRPEVYLWCEGRKSLSDRAPTWLGEPAILEDCDAAASESLKNIQALLYSKRCVVRAEAIYTLIWTLPSDLQDKEVLNLSKVSDAEELLLGLYLFFRSGKVDLTRRRNTSSFYALSSALLCNPICYNELDTFIQTRGIYDPLIRCFNGSLLTLALAIAIVSKGLICGAELMEKMQVHFAPMAHWDVGTQVEVALKLARRFDEGKHAGLTSEMERILHSICSIDTFWLHNQFIIADTGYLLRSFGFPSKREDLKRFLS